MTGVVICGGRRVESTIEVVGRGFEKVGHTVAYVPTRDYTNKEYGSFGPYPDVTEQILSAIESVDAQVIVWIMCKQDYPSGLNEQIKAKYPDVKIGYHSFDDPFVVDTGEYKRSTEFDFAITCCESSIEDYKNIGVPAICLYPPFDSDMQTEYPVSTNYACDISFIATNLYPPARYPYSLYNRVDLVNAVRDIGNMKLFGPWEKRFSWGGEHSSPDIKDIWEKPLRFHELAGVYKASKINLNSHVRPDGYMYLNERFTNVLGTGSFMLVDNVNGLAQLEEDSKGFVIYHNIDDLRDKVKFYLDNDRARNEVCQFGLRLAQSKFINTVFAESIFRFIKDI